MPFFMIRDDITNQKVDAIVCPANRDPIIGGGAEADIHLKAGPSLLEARKAYGYLKDNDIVMTDGFDLKAKHVLHVISPVYDPNTNAQKRLTETYTHILSYAKAEDLDSIAFPLLSSGTYKYPKDIALKAAMASIEPFLLAHDMTIYLVLYDEVSYRISKTLYQDIEDYLFGIMPIKQPVYRSERSWHVDRNEALSLEDIIHKSKETFMMKLFKWIDELQLTDVEVYKKANIDRKLFSKMRSNLNYRPSKETAIALAIALELDLDDTRDLIRKAGYDLSDDINFDLIIRYCIEHNIYNIYQVNEILFDFDQKLLG
jgi:O-acetyl-ADP-ribose deacetylase (regulator of RNase III)